MRFLCRCGNMLTNQLDPNDTEYYVYSDREWSEFEKKGWIYFLDVPYPQYDVWRCEKCDRIYLFKENKVVKVYKQEEYSFKIITQTLPSENNIETAFKFRDTNLRYHKNVLHKQHEHTLACLR